eukprot:TRINITY_DN1081_c4_g1_i10.p5 TRINITY_DN1081_c4_g1~~TRINITY_DN1081_c4_g1_i10.p5  ORF type:complete len:109 (+),score=11.24 TRINITY_DN1081_c4_g1_i10:358-684(+)
MDIEYAFLRRVGNGIVNDAYYESMNDYYLDDEHVALRDLLVNIQDGQHDVREDAIANDTELLQQTSVGNAQMRLVPSQQLHQYDWLLMHEVFNDYHVMLHSQLRNRYG